MSEFPEWLEQRIGLGMTSHQDSCELHRKLKAARELIPEIDDIMARVRPLPSPNWPWWRRYLWYLAQ